jgi:two-component system response regulator NreC
MSGGPIGVFLADDHQVLREGLRTLLERQPDIVVVGEAETGKATVEQVQKLEPDVLVLDLGMSDMNGFEVMRELGRLNSTTRIVVLSMHSGRDFVMQALRAGCHGFVPKSSTHTDLIQAIRATYAGERFLDPSATTAVVAELLDRGEESRLLEQLSQRETEVLKLTALGYTSREIGERLALSPKTVETYRQRAMVKLGLEQRADLVRFALRAGLLKASDD